MLGTILNCLSRLKVALGTIPNCVILLKTMLCLFMMLEGNSSINCSNDLILSD